MTTGINPYVVPDAVDQQDDGSPATKEFEITVATSTVDIGGVTVQNAETYNGTIPGPTLRLDVGDTVVVRLINDLDYPTAIHWHGIELHNSADGTPVTQDPARVGPFPQPVPESPSGGTYLYRFKVTRPGIFWYHPHHFHSTNRVLRGLYGLIVVSDPAHETALSGTLPADTLDLVLSDITVCQAPGANDALTYPAPAGPDAPEWLSTPQTEQPPPAPVHLCEMAQGAIGEDGSPAAADYPAGHVPNIQRSLLSTFDPVIRDRTNEGQRVLTNGMEVGPRGGTPDSPSAATAAMIRHPVTAGEGIRLRIVNCATVRYFRLRLTTDGGALVKLVRVGGEGGLLDAAVFEGGPDVGPLDYDTKYDEGEILLPPASRADVVAVIPPGEALGSVLTLWTRDFQRTGQGYSRIPTVPVAHFEVTGTGGTYALPVGTALRAAVPDPVGALPAATATLLDTATFGPKPGSESQTISLQTGLNGMRQVPTIDGVEGHLSASPYTLTPHIDSTRYAAHTVAGDVLELSVQNNTGAHHPFHLHGFSFQPRELHSPGGLVYTWPYDEYRDNVDVPASHRLVFRVKLEDRDFPDGTTPGGALGRWLFHCHIFFHAHMGMLSELVVSNPDASERPHVDVGGSWAYTPAGGTATRAGTFFHPDGKPVTLTPSIGTLSYAAGTSSGPWTWELDSTGEPNGVSYVYVTATDGDGGVDQTVFRLKIGEPDDGSDTGDPHIHTLRGQRYDFQSAGEFVLLRDREGLEVQTRQWPVPAANPITDPHSGLQTCVSVNTAVAARVGRRRIAYQPTGGERARLQFFLDGKASRVPDDGLDLDGHRVTTFDYGGENGLRVDYAHGPVLTVTPRFWERNQVWYMNVDVSNAGDGRGLMGAIPPGAWLPLLPSGASVGPRPDDLSERFRVLYRTFADAWRVTDATSLFVYAPGTSTATFTDANWPSEEPPCVLDPAFAVPGADPPTEGITEEAAAKICSAVEVDGLHRDCVFDVASTGDPTLAEGYELLGELRRRSTAVQIRGDRPQTAIGESLVVTAIVLPRRRGCDPPEGHVRFLVDGKTRGEPVELDRRGRARTELRFDEPGVRRVRVEFRDHCAKTGFLPSSSPNLMHVVVPAVDRPAPKGGTKGGCKAI